MGQAQKAHTQAGLACREFYAGGEEGRTRQREKLGCQAVKGSADATWGLGAGRPQAGGWGGLYNLLSSGTGYGRPEGGLALVSGPPAVP